MRHSSGSREAGVPIATTTFNLLLLKYSTNVIALHQLQTISHYSTYITDTYSLPAGQKIQF